MHYLATQSHDDFDLADTDYNKAELASYSTSIFLSFHQK